MFSDESQFVLFRSDRRQRVYRHRGERFVDACVREQSRFGGGGVMVWACICHGHKSELVFVQGALNAQSYRDTILQPVVVAFIRRHNVTFQQDNARPHVARICNEYLQANNVDVLLWPAFSPDLSPIEHLWDVLDRGVRRRHPAPTTQAELRRAVHEEWDNITIRQINCLINYVHRRIRAAIGLNGGHTRY